jgi:ribonuclease HII
MDYFEHFAFETVAGLDEAGRGPLAGPVVAAAVILPQPELFTGLTDSKKLSEKKRNQLFEQIMRGAVAVGVGMCSHREIDELNILKATFVAMQRAYADLGLAAECAYVDGNFVPEIPPPAIAVIKGDEKLECISAASVIAKVTRDRLMLDYAAQYPEYCFEKHKGYGTKLHMECLHKHGPSPIHRYSFSPVRKAAQRHAIVT